MLSLNLSRPFTVLSVDSTRRDKLSLSHTMHRCYITIHSALLPNTVTLQVVVNLNSEWVLALFWTENRSTNGLLGIINTNNPDFPYSLYFDHFDLS